MSETPTNVTPPPDLTYGYVDGRIILAIGDRSDAGRMPDPVPADDTTVTLTPANTILKVTTPTPATVIKQPIVCAVDANGYLVDGQGARGVWLVTGTYKVTYSHSRAIIPSHDIEVTTGHTEAAPLDLTTAMPPGGPVLAPSEYAELNGRLAILKADARPQQPWAATSRPATGPTIVTYYPTPNVSKTTEPGPAFSDIDPANLKVTFLAPSSGRVRIRLSGVAQTGYGAGLDWRLAEGGVAVPDTASLVEGPTIGAVGLAKRQSVDLYVDRDASGAYLIPSRSYTFTWQHASTGAGLGYLHYGQLWGAAVIEVQPVSDRLTERTLSSTVTQSTYIPVWLCRDRFTLVGVNRTTGRLAWSTDDAATWSEVAAAPLAGGVSAVRETTDGELLIFAGVDPGVRPPAVFKTSGWSTSRASATYEKKHETNFGGTWTEGAILPWSVDSHGPLVLLAEYGPKVGPAQMARYLYLSRDDGETWSTIFDHADTSTGVGAHLHGVAYDPYWNAIWLAAGDGPGNEGAFVSFDLGQTWRNLNQEQQFTSVFALPEGIVWFTDEGGPNGFYRIPRTHPDALVWEVAHVIDNNLGITYLGTSVFQNRQAPGSPLLLAADTGNIAGGGAVWATYDGHTFKQVFADDGQSYANHGVRAFVGPTLSGKYHGHVLRPDGFYTIKSSLT